ncbi:PIG-L family deacetylase [Mitsuaria sp. GD03876]|uniref:PIG-L deacetylase family protein n=1 Tax=Mitsuaria sp. GD03876 TaxID=2975399 RepID=UPI002446E029|nr:PIG-L family deacetylase [Mitsuaria sp. GD03876]MDH0865822.1 PIG-L family deacetylase [Mitsuaria sp. GD03876]
MEAPTLRRSFSTAAASAAPFFAEAEVAPAPAAAERRIDGQGTPEWAWRQWPPLWGRPLVSLEDLAPQWRRLVVVATHPDDEVIGCGGLLSLLVARHRAGLPPDRMAPPPVEVIGVTSGEASHPGSSRWTTDRLATQRRQERLSGLRRLGLHLPVDELGIPDGTVAAHEGPLAIELHHRLRRGDVVLAPWRLDGHPDHEATGRACARAAAIAGATLLEMPIWAWHWARPGDVVVPWHRMRRLPLAARALRDKRAALAAHRSQLLADGERPPVLFPEAVNRLLRPFEFFLAPDSAS